MPADAKKEKWFAVVERATGELRSTGTEVAKTLPDDLEAIEIEGKPAWKTQKWDKEQRKLVPKPAAELRPDIIAILLRMTLAEQRALLKASGLSDQRISELEAEV